LSNDDPKREGLDRRFPSIMKAASGLKARSCLVDGEAVACDGRGSAMSGRIRYGAPMKACSRLPSTCSNSTARTYGASRSKPARDAGEPAARLWGRAAAGHLEHGGDVVYRHACKLGCEGIVSKRFGSPYVSGRTRHWLKFKNPAALAVKREAEEEWG